MEKTIYSPLQLRELFHLEFLRRFSRKTKTNSYVLKGGSNLRFFFNSARYSEDMDLDIQGVAVHMLKDIVMKILNDSSFQDAMISFGIESIVPPDISAAKQTETTQRFKAHLITFAGEDLFTKIEFSRRGFLGKAVVQSVSDHILRAYKFPPLLVSHYDVCSMAEQKIGALSDRALIQARDIFDLYILSSQCEPSMAKQTDISSVKLTKAYKNVFEVSFEQFKDTVVTYLSPEDRPMHDLPSSWDEIKLKAANFIEEMRNLK